MTTHKLSDKVYYIGVNDRVTPRFESLWPLPSGVSYNSYLVTGGEKTAIIEGVEVSHALEQIAHIRAILGDRHPDYLVIDHMEPDHSGAIALLRKEFPDLAIVGNAQTLGMVKGFYGVEGNAVTVKDGDRLDLGGDTTLRFVLTPMVHWPETMMTYLEQESTLFSGDAFGCFGALNGAVVDTRMNVDRYFSEMIRYYSNIVGKYGTFVQRALKKLTDTEVGTICPTHGPVWRDNIEKVVDLYDRLSRYEPLDNGVTIVYGSMYGNTAVMAETAAEELAAAGVRDIAVHNAATSDISYILADIFTHRGLVLAAPTYSDSIYPPVANVLQAIATRGIKRPVAVFGSYTWAPQAAKQMKERLEAAGMQPVADPVSSKQAPDSDALAQVRASARALAKELK